MAKGHFNVFRYCKVVSIHRDFVLQRAADLKMSLANVEKEKGVSGFTDTQEELERVSALKGDLDIKKAASLEEMSKMVTKLKDRFQPGCV